jgi:SAM-dependent methyltransferase
MNLVPPQTDREELLDLQRGTLAQVRRSLHDIRRINTYLGGASVVCNATMAMLQQHRLQSATVLDIGTGSADIPVRLVQLAKAHKIDLRVLALDNNARHLQVAREDLEQQKSSSCGHLLQADAFRLPLHDNAVDIVVSSLFLHHFRAPQIVELLREFQRVSRIGWVMNDLVRHYVPLIFFRLTKPIFARSYITRHDGEASLRRGYTVEEMQHIVNGAPELQAHVREHFPYRMSIVGEKQTL